MEMKCAWPLMSAHFVTLCNLEAPYMWNGYSLCAEHARKAVRSDGIGEVMKSGDGS